MPNRKYDKGTVIVVYNSLNDFNSLNYRYSYPQLWIAIWIVLPIVVSSPILMYRHRKIKRLKATSVSEIVGLSEMSKQALLKHNIQNLYQLFNLDYYSLIHLGFSEETAEEIHENAILLTRYS